MIHDQPMTMDVWTRNPVLRMHPYGLASWRQEIVDWVEEKQSKGMEYHGRDNLTDAWRTPWDMQKRYPDLVMPLREILDYALNHVQPHREYGVCWRDCWIAKYGSNSGANLHNHGNEIFGWSFCYYVRVPDQGPGFTIKSGDEYFTFNVAEGDFLFFRSHIDHQVFPLGVDAEEDRIIISGNLGSIDNFFLLDGMLDDDNYLDKLKIKKYNVKFDPDDWEKDIFHEYFESNRSK